MMRIILACAAALVLCVGLAPPADATSIRELDLDTLVETADVILLGTAGASESVTRGKRFVTRTPLTVERVVKGSAPGSVVVETAGGRSGNIGQRVSGTARFADGEQIIVFLTRLESGAYRVRGMSQGKLTVVPGLAGGRVLRDLGGLTLVGADGARAGSDGQAMPLDDFLVDLAVRVTRAARLEAETLATPPAAGEVAR